MEQEFRQNNYNGRDQFLRRQRNNKDELERQERRLFKIARVQSVIRAALCRIRTFKGLQQEALANMPLVLQKQQELPPNKAAKVMENLVYRMPYFLQAVLPINEKNYRVHWQYLAMLMAGLSQRVDSKAVVIARLLEKNDFAKCQLVKMVPLCMRMLDAMLDPAYLRFLEGYFQECEEAGVSDRLKEGLKSIELRRVILRLVLSQHTPTQLASMLVNHTVIQHTQLFHFLNLEECASLALKFPQVISDEFLAMPALQAPPVFPTGFLAAENSEQALQNYQQSCRLLEEALLPVQIRPERLSFALLLNNLALERYSARVKETVMMRFYHKRTLIETIDNREQIGAFLNSIDPKLYSERLLLVLTSALRGVSASKGATASIFEPLSDIYIRVLQLFQDSFTNSLNSQASHDLVEMLFGMLKDTDLRVSRTVTRTVDRLFELFIVLLNREFKLMDDYQLVNESYSRDTLVNLIEFLLRQLARVILQQERSHKVSPYFSFFTDLLANLYEKNYRTKLLDPAVFVGDMQLNRLFQECRFDNKQEGLFKQLSGIPFVISLEYRYFKFIEALQQDYVPRYEVAGLITIQRDRQFLSAFQQLVNENLLKRFQFEFVDRNGHREPGVDMGGPTKEFLSRACRQVFHPKFGMFIETPTKEVIPNPHNRFQPDHYEFAGQLVAKAMREKVSLQPQFSGIFLNILLGVHNTLDDLQYLNKEIHRNLMQIKHSKGGNVADLELTFEIVEEYTDWKGQSASRFIELREGGRYIPVTEKNKMDFVMDYADYLVNRQIMKESMAFKKGMYKLLSGAQLKLFNHDELNRIISGSTRSIDFADLRKFVAYSEYKPKDTTIVLFWRVLEEFDQQQREQFLLFVTACSRPPLLGFRQLSPQLRIVKAPDSDNLPTAQTCGNILNLPDYQNERKLKEKLLLAIQNNTGFGMA